MTKWAIECVEGQEEKMYEFINNEWVVYDVDGECRPATPYEIITIIGIID